MGKTQEPFTGSLANSWTTVRGSTPLTISNGRGVQNVATTNTNARCNFDVGSPDMYIQCLIPGRSNWSDANRTIFPMVRCVSSGTAGGSAVTYYSVSLNAQANTITMLRYVSGTATQIGNTYTGTFPSGDSTVRLEAEGTSLRFYFNGGLIHNLTDSNISGNTMGGVGFYNGQTLAWVDDVEIGSLYGNTRLFLPF